MCRDKSLFPLLPVADKGQQPPLATTCHYYTHPRDDKLSTKVLHFRLDLATDVELVAVESDALKVGQQVLLTGRVWALKGEAAQH